MVVFSFLVALPLLGAAAAAGSTETYVHDTRTAPARGYTALASATDEHVLDLRVHLAQSNPSGLERALLDISTPGSASYGQHLSPAQIATFTKPTAASTQAVRAFFVAHGLNATDASAGGDWLAVKVPATQANELLGANFTVYAHTASGRTLVRTLQYSLPTALRGHVTLVHPTTSFFTSHNMPVRKVSTAVRAATAVPLPQALHALNATTAIPEGAARRTFAHISSLASGGPGLPGLAGGLCDIDLSDLPPFLSAVLEKVLKKLCGEDQNPDPTDSVPSIPTDLPTGTISMPNPTDTVPSDPTDFPTGTVPLPNPTDPVPEPTDTDPDPVPFPTDIPTDSSSTSAPSPTGNPNPAPSAPSSCQRKITPACLQALYGIPTTPATQKSNTLGVTGYLNQFAQDADLESFLQQFRPDIDPQTTFDTQTLDGGRNPQEASQAGIEANLDVQYTIGLATGVPTTFISVGNGDGQTDNFLDTINALIQAQNPPQVLTTSYGGSEADMGPTEAQALCNAYMQLGARGVSILFASGDSGVGDPQGACAQGDGTFAPMFPSGCPYVTSVGSTQGFAPETAASFSSGGFSDVFPAPSYQADAVKAYLSQLGDTNAGKFTPTGRAYPDVSTQGVNFGIVSGGRLQGVQGTSASSPTFASVIALLNDELAAAGKPPLGFLNPWLYSNAAAFNDVVDGNNPGCGSDGFPAAAGWDPVTGLGTPSYAALRKAAGLS